MNKKILIASLFATLMLMVPMTSVVGVSDIEDDGGCEVVSGRNLVRVKRLLARLGIYINIILLRFGYISGVREKCQEILDLLNSDIQDFPIICDILEPIFNQLMMLCALLYELYYIYEDNPIIVSIINALIPPAAFITAFVNALGATFRCWE